MLEPSSTLSLVFLRLLDALAQAAPQPDPDFQPRHDSLWDHLLGLTDLFLALAGIGLILLLLWILKPRRGPGAYFTISVDEDDITYSGNFPASAEAAVSDFLRNDCPVEGFYEIRGRWDSRVLLIEVRGENARFVQQRIRNFLKLTLKPPNSAETAE